MKIVEKSKHIYHHNPHYILLAVLVPVVALKTIALFTLTSYKDIAGAPGAWGLIRLFLVPASTLVELFGAVYLLMPILRELGYLLCIGLLSVYSIYLIGGLFIGSSNSYMFGITPAVVPLLLVINCCLIHVALKGYKKVTLKYV